MQVTVLWFGMLRERRGRNEEQIELSGPRTVQALYRELCPPGAQGELPVGFALNGDHVGASSEVNDGDVVVFLPPVGGG